MSAMEEYSSRAEVNPSDNLNDIIVGNQREEHVNDAVVLAAEESLNESVISHGPCSEQTRDVATHLVLAYNHFAMKKLSENNIKVSLRAIYFSDMHRIYGVILDKRRISNQTSLRGRKKIALECTYR